MSQILPYARFTNVIVGFFAMQGIYEIIIRPLYTSFRYGQTNSGLVPSPASGVVKKTPTRTTVSPVKTYQVFVNFRGEEVRYNFISHMTNALHRNHIKFFIDKDELRGKDINNLFVRIEESRIALAVISTRYTESEWCMNELVKIMKLVHKGTLVVIPIFYQVDALDVKNPTWNTNFGRNFLNLAEVSNADKVKEWKEALDSVCNKMGLSLSEKSSESDFIEEIVKELQRIIETMEREDEENYE